MSRIKHTSPFILSCLLSGVAGTAFAQESSQEVDQAYTPLPPYELPVAPPSASDKNSFYYTIPRWIDSTPTVLPEQSNEPIVPPTAETEHLTWFDQRQKIFVIGPIKRHLS